MSTVTAVLTLAGDVIVVAGAEGSPARSIFVASFVTDVAVLLSVAEGQVKVTSIAAGSVVVSFEASPAADGTPVAAAVISSAFSDVVALPTVGVETTWAVSGVGTTTVVQPDDIQEAPSVDVADGLVSILIFAVIGLVVLLMLRRDVHISMHFEEMRRWPRRWPSRRSRSLSST